MLVAHVWVHPFDPDCPWFPKMDPATQAAIRLKWALRAQIMLDQLAAMRKLRRVFALSAPETPAEIDRRWKEWGGAEIVAHGLAIIEDDQANVLQKILAGEAVDWFIPGWRENASAGVWPVLERDDPRARRWRSDVLRRDGSACVDCGAVDKLHAHHIIRWSDAPWLRLELDNGKTLCEPCHLKAHGGNYRAAP